MALALRGVGHSRRCGAEAEAAETPAATGITWGFRPEDAEQAIADVASLGYHGYESFGNVLEAGTGQGGLDKRSRRREAAAALRVLPVNLTDPAMQKDEIAKLLR